MCCAGNPADQGMFNLCSFISIPDVDNAFASILVRCAISIFVRQNPVLLVVIPAGMSFNASRHLPAGRPLACLDALLCPEHRSTVITKSAILTTQSAGRPLDPILYE